MCVCVCVCVCVLCVCVVCVCGVCVCVVCVFACVHAVVCATLLKRLCCCPFCSPSLRYGAEFFFFAINTSKSYFNVDRGELEKETTYIYSCLTIAKKSMKCIIAIYRVFRLY